MNGDCSLPILIFRPVQFKAAGEMLRPFVTQEFPKTAITRILYGPASVKLFNANAIERLLTKHEYWNVPVEPSAITLR
jgi:hypothetical protein